MTGSKERVCSSLYDRLGVHLDVHARGRRHKAAHRHLHRRLEREHHQICVPCAPRNTSVCLQIPVLSLFFVANPHCKNSSTLSWRGREKLHTVA
eukprot:320556-Rhodomonas_salina.1